MSTTEAHNAAATRPSGSSTGSLADERPPVPVCWLIGTLSADRDGRDLGADV
jgi:hypothetical protein